MSKPKISVIIPVYNCINYLTPALESVIKQHYENLEILLVDDGSSDGSSLMCDELSSAYECVKVLHKPNGGAASARNAGLDYYLESERDVADEYIAFLDSDDAWTTDFIDNSVVEAMASRVDIISFQTCPANSSLTRRGVPTPVKAGDNCGGAENVWSCGSTSFAAALYRADFLKKYNLRFENIKANEDVIFSIYSHYLASSIRVIEKIMYFYRSNKSSVTHNRRYGIPMYDAVIEALLSADGKMSKHFSPSRGELHSCTELAHIYIDDMVSEHFAIGGKASELEAWKKSSYLSETERVILEKSMSKYDKSRIIKLRFRYRIKSFVRSLCKIEPIQALIDAKRFPIKMSAGKR